MRKMEKSDKIISLLITITLAVAFLDIAVLFVLNYNKLFADGGGFVETVESSSDVSGNKITLNMKLNSISNDISDSELEALNTYGFPQGDSPYFLYAEKGAHTLSVFSKDNYGLYTKLVATWYTGMGKSDSLTPVGTFSISTKEEWHHWGAGTVSPYATKYSNVRNHYGGLFIHGPIYTSPSFSSVLGGSVMNIGTNCSSGCLRTEAEAAYFVYRMCPEGTQLKIVDGSPLGFTPYRKVYVDNQKRQPTLEKFELSSVAPRSISFSEESHTMTVGEEYSPTIVTVPSYAKKIDGIWSTNHSDIVKVSGNTIWAVGTGSAMVYLNSADGNLSAAILINVVAKSVDTSAAPPDVEGKNTDLSDEDILANYQPISANLLKLRINGTLYSLDENVRPLLRALGAKDYKVESSQSCAYVGLDKSYTYTYLKDGKVGKCIISTVPIVEGEDNICEINIRTVIDATLETTKGIQLGSSRSDVERAYGKYYTETEVVSENDAYIKMIYWAGTPNQPGQPYLYFFLTPDSGEVTGMGIYSGKNAG